MNVTLSLPETPPEALAARYPGARWTLLAGGRSNRLWKVTAPGAVPLVIKFHDPNRTGPLFPNLPADEALAMRALDSSGLAPRLVADTPWLTYEFAPGRTPCASLRAAASVLARLHERPAPKALRRLPGGHEAVLALGDEMAAGRPELARLRPSGAVPPSSRNAFLHGDPVPANMVETASGAVLIDWQCPAAGDPCEDIAVFLSPSMQSLYGGAPVPPAGIAAFFDAYGDPEIAARYAALAPAYHWRMAAYCLWMADRGHADYAAAARLEIEALQK